MIHAARIGDSAGSSDAAWADWMLRA